MASSGFIDKNPTLDTYWRSAILLGRNTASYKFALAKTLLELPKKENFIGVEDLAIPFSKNISDHLQKNDRQSTGAQNSFLESCRKFNRSEINESELVSETTKHGFRYVFDAFHNVAQSEIPKFFEKTTGGRKGLTLTDNFYQLLESEQSSNLSFEVESRWRLWETALSLEITPTLIEINTDGEGEILFVLDNRTKRIDVTSSRNALSGYQKGKCFYCWQGIAIDRGFENSCDVDHFFPHMLSQYQITNLDQVWNLVLSCKDCNRGEGGKFERIPEILYLELLNKRNNYYVESHHPLRETIMRQTGKTGDDRRRFLQKFFDSAIDFIPSTTKWKSPRFQGEQF